MDSYTRAIRLYQDRPNLLKLEKAFTEMVNLRIVHLRIGYLVGNPDPYQLSGLPTSIITLFFVLSGLFRVVSTDFGCFRMISMNPIY